MRISDVEPVTQPAGALDLADDMIVARPLPAGAVRTRVIPRGQTWELTVVTTDRRGVLYRSCRAMAEADIDIRSAAITTIAATVDTAPPLAVQRFVVVPGPSHRDGEPNWADLAIAIRIALGDPSTATPTQGLPTGVNIRAIDQIGPDTYEILIEGPDRVGLLRELCESLFAFNADIVSAEVHSVDGRAEDRFVVRLDNPSTLRMLLGLTT